MVGYRHQDNQEFLRPFVELNWPGKYEADGSRRRPNAAYPPQDISHTLIERFELNQTDSPTVSPSRGRLIHGDLRLVLPLLKDESIDFIYVDPPFATARNHTAQLSSNDSIQRRTGRNKSRRVIAYSDTWTTTDYLNFLDDLIQLAHPKLKPTGVIAIHTDHRASAYVRCLLDEHFIARPTEPGAFINELIWKYGLGNARAKRYFLRKHDTIACYGKSSDYYFNMVRGPATKSQLAKYCHEDEHGRYMLSYGKKYYFKGGKPFESVIDIPALSATASERCGYPTQKPIALLQRLIEAFCPPGGTVLDPCAGSGTTAVTAAQLGRDWITADQQPLAVQTTQNRLVSLESSPISFTSETVTPPDKTFTMRPDRETSVLESA